MSSRTWVGATPWTGTLLVKATAVGLISFSPSICVVSSVEECAQNKDVLVWQWAAVLVLCRSVGVFLAKKAIAISGWLTEAQEIGREQRKARNLGALSLLSRLFTNLCARRVLPAGTATSGRPGTQPNGVASPPSPSRGSNSTRAQPARHTRLAPEEGLEMLDERHLVERRVAHPCQSALAHLFLDSGHTGRQPPGSGEYNSEGAKEARQEVRRFVLQDAALRPHLMDVTAHFLLSLVVWLYPRRTHM
jgi:hypothetical protein